QLVDVVYPRIVDVANEEPEVERCREQYEEAEDDLFEIHAPPAGQVADAWPSMFEVIKLSHARREPRPLDEARTNRNWLPNGPVAQDSQPVRRSRASITVGQTSI